MNTAHNNSKNSFVWFFFFLIDFVSGKVDANPRNLVFTSRRLPT